MILTILGLAFTLSHTFPLLGVFGEVGSFGSLTGGTVTIVDELSSLSSISEESSLPLSVVVAPDGLVGGENSAPN